MEKNYKLIEESELNLTKLDIKLDYLKRNIQILFETHFTYKYGTHTQEILDKYVSSIHFSNCQVVVLVTIISVIVVLIGICCIISYYYNIDMDSDAEFKSIFPMFRAFFVICLYIWLLGINVYVWDKAKINYKLAFQFSSHYSDVLSIFKRAACFSAVFVLMYICYMILRIDIPYFIDLLSFIPLELTPFVCWVILSIYMLSPFKGFFNYQGR